jgi:uncharacterized protein
VNKNELRRKKDYICKQLAQFPNLCVCFSGGVDSTLLLGLAGQVLDDRVVAVTAVSPLISRREVDEAVKLARVLNVRHQVLEVADLFVPEFSANRPDRCYVCKKILFSNIFKTMQKAGIVHMAHGANLDDQADYRPGMKAADEMGVAAPLKHAGFGKQEIRALAKEMNLPNWNRPAAACLATRIPYHIEITQKKLEMIEAAENVLTTLGFSGFRVRHFGDTAKIEVRPSDFERLMQPEKRVKIVTALRSLGFSYITMDLEGYGQGRLNRTIL